MLLSGGSRLRVWVTMAPGSVDLMLVDLNHSVGSVHTCLALDMNGLHLYETLYHTLRQISRNICTLQ